MGRLWTSKTAAADQYFDLALRKSVQLDELCNLLVLFYMGNFYLLVNELDHFGKASTTELVRCGSSREVQRSAGAGKTS